MAEYISREAAIEAYLNLLLRDGEIYTTDVTDVLRTVPAADVAPVRRGRWFDCEPYNPEFNGYECSECGARYQGLSPDNFCPNCGAKMEADNG